MRGGDEGCGRGRGRRRKRAPDSVDSARTGARRIIEMDLVGHDPIEAPNRRTEGIDPQGRAGTESMVESIKFEDLEEFMGNLSCLGGENVINMHTK